MIQRVTSLQADCTECGERANFRVVRTNDELPAKYVQWGTRSLYYCSEHMPDDARDFFAGAVAPGEEALIKVPR